LRTNAFLVNGVDSAHCAASGISANLTIIASSGLILLSVRNASSMVALHVLVTL
jgi:hypothetical protein